MSKTPRHTRLSDAELDSLITIGIDRPMLIRIDDKHWVGLRDIVSVTEDTEDNTHIALRKGSSLSYIQIDQPIREVIAAITSAIIVAEGIEEGVRE